MFHKQKNPLQDVILKRKEKLFIGCKNRCNAVKRCSNYDCNLICETCENDNCFLTIKYKINKDLFITVFMLKDFQATN